MNDPVIACLVGLVPALSALIYVGYRFGALTTAVTNVGNKLDEHLVLNRADHRAMESDLDDNRERIIALENRSCCGEP